MDKVRATTPVRIPDDLCCNCGSAGPLRAVSTAFQLPGFGLGDFGTQLRAGLPFPYCEGCAATARLRPRETWLLVVGVAFALFLFVLFPLLIALEDERLVSWGLPATVLVAWGAVRLGKRLARPAGPRTSRRCPVIAVAARGAVRGAPSAITVAFTNPTYAARYAALNGSRVLARPVLGGPLIVLAWAAVWGSILPVLILGLGIGFQLVAGPAELADDPAFVALGLGGVGALWAGAVAGRRLLSGRATPEADVLVDHLRLLSLAVPLVFGVSFALGLGLRWWQG